jgi:hypothetical protein
MALTINPAVSRGSRRWILHCAAFFAGALAGAVVSLLGMLALARLLDVFAPASWLPSLLLPLVGWAALHDLGVPVALPYRQRQVPEALRQTLPPAAVAVVFGGMLGVGFLTLFTYSAHVAMLVALPFVGSVGTMLGIVAVFALGKTLALGAAAGASSLDQVADRFVWTRARDRVLRWTTASASLALAGALIASV